MLSFNMMVPPKVRAGLSGRPLDATEIMSKLKLPVLATHGAEDATRFNTELAAFVREANKTN
jgi:non-heme chloroperoxidase